jgi:hypothetical protein
VGKGDKQRPTDREAYEANWNQIFKKEKVCLKKCQADMTTQTCLGCLRTYEEIRKAGLRK